MGTAELQNAELLNVAQVEETKCIWNVMGKSLGM
jgi:hypothetical protein